MGEIQNQPFQLSFNAALKVDFRGGAGDGKVSETSVGEAITPDFGTFKRGRAGPFRGRWRRRASKTRLAIAFGGGQAYVVGRGGVHNGNSGLDVIRSIKMEIGDLMQGEDITTNSLRVDYAAFIRSTG
jgi:hypothetical protein